MASGCLRRCLRPRFAAHRGFSAGASPLAPSRYFSVGNSPFASKRCFSAAAEAVASSSSIGTGPTDAFGIETATPQALATFHAWHDSADAVLSGRESQQDAMARLRPHMRDDCVFRPPTYHGAWTGADETCLLLGTVSEVFGSSFRYGRQWLGEDGHEWALEFTTEVGAGSKKLLTGIDLVSLDEAGKIKEFTVLARPPNAVALLKDEMMRRVPMRLAAMKAKKAMGLL